MEGRILALWEKYRKWPSGSQPQRSTFESHPLFEPGEAQMTDSFYPIVPNEHERHTIFFGSARRQSLCENLCGEFRDAAQMPGAFEKLNNRLTSLITVEIVSSEMSEAVTGRVFSLLQRMPPSPPPFSGATSYIMNHQDGLQAYTILERQRLGNISWEDLEVVSKFSDETICTLLNYTSTFGDFWERTSWDGWKKNDFEPSLDPRTNYPSDHWTVERLDEYSNVLAELLETSVRMSDKAGRSEDSMDIAWFIVKCFLWCAWQRSILLTQWFSFEKAIKWGLYEPTNLFLRGSGLYRDRAVIEEDKSPYICNWAYESIKTDRMSGANDLRHFHTRFKELWGSAVPRCDKSGAACSGMSPKDCHRFVGAEVQDQTMHDYDCDGQCSRLHWDPDSYRHVAVGARAVCIKSSTEMGLKYRKSSGLTMSISHVWSHGQGGRPEVDGSGLNHCLHLRYVAIAEAMGCDSYWMDTPCIPADHVLRKEAIQNINKVFRNSKVTLVCDRDIMNVDVASFNIAKKESILATLLVSDWNVRAWTYLESLRGRSHIYLLFRDNVVMSLRSILEDVAREGRIDLAVLFQDAVHLLPPPQGPEKYFLPARAADEWVSRGFITSEHAAAQLSHRQASRRGDDVVIWSLLVGESACQSPTDFWTSRRKSLLGAHVTTGFLFSSVPRISNVKSLGWAPVTPTCERLSHDFYLAADGRPSKPGYILDHGLDCEFAVHVFDPTSKSETKPYQASVLAKLESIPDTAHWWIGLLQPLLSNPLEGHATAYRYRGKESGAPLLAICVSDDQKEWAWKGVFEWNEEEDLPTFLRRRMLII